MKEDIRPFLDRLQWEWQGFAEQYRREQTDRPQAIQNLRDVLAAVAAQAGDQHAALKRLADESPTVGTLNTIPYAAHRHDR